MRQTLVAGNWKMHGSRASIIELLEGLASATSSITQVEMAVFPPAPYLSLVQDKLASTPIEWGAQNVSEHDNGAFTGEFSAAMLTDFSCHYVIVGHSERRSLYGEDNEAVANKFAAAQSKGLVPILCVGETLEQRDNQQTLDIIQAQIQAVLSLKGGVNVFQHAVIAYEPVWAIGTGLTATPEQAQAVHAAIRAEIAELDSEIADSLRILYGGSVKPDNAAGLFTMADIDGALVGGASLKAQDFVEICQAGQG